MGENGSGDEIGNVKTDLSLDDQRSDSSNNQTIGINNSTVTLNGGSRLNISMGQLRDRFKEQPFWVKIGALLLVLVFIVVVFILLSTRNAGANAFLQAIDDGIGPVRDQFSSSQNIILNVIPSNIIPENGPDQWDSISRLWERAGETFEAALQPAASCLRAGSCYPDQRAKEICGALFDIAKSYNDAMSGVMSLDVGLQINMSIGDPMAPFGEGVINIPPIDNLTTVVNECTKNGLSEGL